MKVTQTGNVTWMIDFGENWSFVQYMWRSMLENDRGIITLQNFRNLQQNLKKEPLSEFNNDRDLKSFVCVSIVMLNEFLDKLIPIKHKEGKFVLTIRDDKQMLELSVL